MLRRRGAAWQFGVAGPSRRHILGLSDKPWNTVDVPQEIFESFGMIGPEERRCFWWLARNCATGEGTIVDAGAFVGASTLCFASGAAAAGLTDFQGGKLIHAYDYFAAIDAYVAEAIAKKFRPIERGESYLDVFELQTAKYAALIEAHPGDFMQQRWSGAPVDILFIDVAKRAWLNSHAIAEFFPSLVPGRSIVVHQDYYHCWHPYIHIGMEFFGDAFELVDELVPFQSRVWRLVERLPPEKIARMTAYDLGPDERLALLDRLIARSSPVSRPMMEVVRLWQICLDKDYDRVAEELARMRREHGLEGRHELWCRQALMVEKYRAEHLAGAKAP